MMSRREFVTDAAAGVAAITLSQGAFAAKTIPPLGVQLYTVRRQLEKDLPGTLAAIRKIGYQTVETFGTPKGLSGAELRKTISAAGLTAPCAHFNYDVFGAHFDFAKELGVECMVCSMVPLAVAVSADGYKRIAEQYNAWGAQAKKLGLRFGFHNHDMEFISYGGVTGQEILLENTDPALVGWEMDCYWVAQAGFSPVEMLEKHGSRIQSLHLKDRKPNVPVSFDTNANSAHFTEVGTGTLDWPAILRLASQHPEIHLFVEQDETDRPPLESLAISYANLKKLLAG